MANPFSPVEKDAFFRSHVVEAEEKKAPSSSYSEPKWPKFALALDTETTLDPRTQELIFGFYRVLHLNGAGYECVEEGIVHADNLTPEQLQTITRYARAKSSEVVSDDYDERLHVYSRSDFVEKVLFKAVQTGSLIVAFNAPFDLSRLSIGHRTGRGRDWTLILAQRTSRKTGKLEPNPERPGIRVVSKDSKAAFFSLTKPFRPQEWPHYFVGKRRRGKRKTRLIFRVLDLRTFAWSIFSKSFSLKTLCEQLKTPNKKFDHEPTGTVTEVELNYCRQDVRCTVDALNALKKEFDLHPIDLHPDKTFSPASFGKAYLKAMSLIPPSLKFETPDYISGIAAQAYFGGRAECRIRKTPVPVVHTDFLSQYPTVNSLLGNWTLLTAESLTFEDATSEVKEFIEQTTLEDCFQPATWKKLRFFACVLPEDDIFPVRAEYGKGDTKNIGLNYFTSKEPRWFSGSDILASKLLTGKTPRIVKAIRVVPHGQQKGLKTVKLRGKVKINPRNDDPFRLMVEQRQDYKRIDPGLADFLKYCANSTSYGMFFELTPKPRVKPVKVKVYSGEHSHEQRVKTVEKPGEWYYPPIAALITGGSHLLLAMVERCISVSGGHYLFCDTDSMCIVASRRGGLVPSHGKPIKALTWKQVANISKRFESLNCYDLKKVPGSILKIEKVNYVDGKQSDLFGYSISAKRYVLYRYDANGNLVIVDAKAHGLGYLHQPKRRDEGDWITEAWRWLLEGELATPQFTPEWFPFPAMMSVPVSTPAVLGRLRGFTKPFNFVLVPLQFEGPSPKDKPRPSLVVPFTKNLQNLWDEKAVDTNSGKLFSICPLGTRNRRRKIEIKTYGNVLASYRDHAESKFVGLDGLPCDESTRGLLQRTHVIAARPRYIGKEVSRRLERGSDMSIVDFRSAEYAERMVVADFTLRQRIRRIGIRKTARLTKLDSKTVMLIVRGGRIKQTTLDQLISGIAESHDF